MTVATMTLAGALSLTTLLDKAECKKSIPLMVAGMVGVAASVMTLAWEIVIKAL